MSETLYDLSMSLERALWDVDRAEDDDERAALVEALQPILEAQLAKVDRYAEFMAHLESQVELGKKEVARLQARIKSFEAHKQRLEDFAIRTMSAIGKDEIVGENHTLKLAKNPPALRINSEAAIPDEFRVIVPQTFELDKIAIKAALKAKREVPGAELTVGVRLKRS